MEASFPRGGGSGNAQTISKERASEKRSRSTDQKDNDFLFGDRSTKKPKSRSSSARHTSVITPLELGGGGVSAYTKSRGSVIESLSFSKLFPGMKLLGIVRQVTDDFAVVSLPNCLTGFVRRKTKTDPPLTMQVRLYQTLAVAITRTSSDEQKGVMKRRIELSLLPRYVNAGVIDTYNGMLLRGQVMSLEDHGAVVDVGLSGVVAFLPFEQIEGFSGFLEDAGNESETDGSESDDTESSDDESDVDADDQESSTEDDDDIPPQEEPANCQSKICVGMIIDVIVKSKSKKQARPLLMLHLPLASSLAKSIENESDASNDTIHYTIKALQPGLKVRCVVDGYARNGLLVSFLGCLRGAIDTNHLGGLYSGTDGWKEVFYAKAKSGGVRGVTARIIAVDAASKIIRLSLIPHLLNLCLPPPFPNYVANGEIIEDKCTVLRVDNGVGVLLALPLPEQEKKEDDSDEDEDEKSKKMVKKKKKKLDPLESEEHILAAATRAIFVHVSKVVDQEKNKKSRTKSSQRVDLVKLFKVGDKIPQVRVLATGQALVEGWGIGSLQKSVVDADALVSHDDVVPGKIYRGVEILSIESQGVLVGLGSESSRVKAMCLNMHLEDAQLSTDASHIKQKLTVGKKIDSVRVLSVDPRTKRCFVTFKKSLLRDKQDLICTFDDCKPGRTGLGHITKLTARGVYVTFYNNVHGFIPARTLARDAGVEDPRQAYFVGNSLHCRVDKLQKRDWGHLLTLSLDVGVEPEELLSKTTSDLSTIAPGKLLKDGKVIELSYGEDSDDTKAPKNFRPGYALLHFKSPANVECRLSFDQLMDLYEDGTLNNTLLNGLAKKKLSVGEKVKVDAVVLTSGTGSKLPSITLKESLVSAAATSPEDGSSIIFPTQASDLYIGAVCVGYVARIDERFGAFVRFLDGLTGLIPKLKKGCEMQLFRTVRCKVISLDLTDEDRPKITLRQTEKISNLNNNGDSDVAMNRLKVGDKIKAVEVESVNFRYAIVNVIDEAFADGRGRVRVHFTMAVPIDSGDDMTRKKKRKKNQTTDKTSTASLLSEEDDVKGTISEDHPFYTWKKGGVVRNLTVVGIEIKEGLPYVELSNMNNSKEFKLWTIKQLKPGLSVSGIVSSYAPRNGGLWIQVSPGVQGLIPGMELSTDVSRLNNMKSCYPIGSRIEAVVTSTKSEKLNLSVLLQEEYVIRPSEFMTEIVKPKKGDTVIGRIHRSMAVIDGPSLMLNLRGRFSARCCLTELREIDDWENMPLGKIALFGNDSTEVDDDEEGEDTSRSDTNLYDNGIYAECRVLGTTKSNTCLNVSMRQSRLEGDLDHDLIPEVGEITRAYVKRTDKKGCFVRLSTKLGGRIILKELSEDFIPNPGASFPPGRLITAKVKTVTSKGGQSRVDLDMRESSLLEDGTLLTLEDVKGGSKMKGVVSRVERYGVFVKLDNSDLTGMCHLSECSDSFVGNLSDMFDPGDRVKVLVIKKDEKRISLGMKASYFVNDVDSSDDDDDSNSDDDSESSELEAHNDSFMSDESSDTEVSPKKSAKVSQSIVEPMNSSNESSAEEDGESDDEDHALDVADVGFDWDRSAPKRNLSNAVKDSDSESSSDDDDSEEESGRHSSRKKAAKRRREEEEVSRREAQLADGTADENPVTTGDFERLLAGDPNSSEIYIRYMAHHLSLSDIDAARAVAERAFQRIEFRQEGEKLNVWTALLALELKYGSEQSVQNAMDRASNQNNPKQVYLRVCEMLEKDVHKFDLLSSKSKGFEEALQRAGDMYKKMCKKFRGKKTVWVAHMRFLLKLGKHSDAHDVLKKSIRSLPNYKHVTVMAKLAQLEFEFGSAERARTVFDGLMEKFPKRLDLVFVHVDKELKHGGGLKAARTVFQKLVNPQAGSEKRPKKYSDKQMKSLFKKWFKMEEDFGDEESQEMVKLEARAYVERVA